MPVAKAQTDIVANDSQFQAAVGRTLGGLASMKTQFIAFGKIAAGAFVGVVGVGALFAKEAAEAERGVAKLRATLGETEGADALTQSLTEQASAIQRTTTYTDDFIISMQTVASGMGIAKDQIDNTVRAALALSAATNNMLSVEGAMRALTKASAEDEAALNKYLPQLKAVGDAAGRTAVLTEVLAKGQRILEADAETTAGRFERLKNQFGEFAETVGGTLLPLVNSGMTSVAETSATVAAAISVAWTNIGDVIGLAGDYVALAFVSTFEDISHGLTVTIPTYLSWLAENWQNVFVDLATAVGTIVTNMHANLVDFFTGIFVWLQGGEFDWEWRGLLDGFESTLTELPQIAERELSDLEVALNDSIDDMQPKLSKAFSDKLKEFRAAFGLGVPKGGPAATPKVPSITLGDTTKGKTSASKQSEAAQASIIGLEELWRRISTAASSPREAKQERANEAAVQTADHTGQIARSQQESTAHLATIASSLSLSLR